MRERSQPKNCSELRRRFADAGRAPTARWARHLERCADCRAASRLAGEIRRELSAAAKIAPPAELDDRIRRMLAVLPIPPPATLRPALATGLAVAGSLAFVGGAGSWLAAQGAAEMGPLYVGICSCAYMTLCCAASLPLLLLNAVALRRRPEVNP